MVLWMNQGVMRDLRDNKQWINEIEKIGCCNRGTINRGTNEPWIGQGLMGYGCGQGPLVRWWTSHEWSSPTVRMWTTQFWVAVCGCDPFQYLGCWKSLQAASGITTRSSPVSMLTQDLVRNSKHPGQATMAIHGILAGSHRRLGRNQPSSSTIMINYWPSLTDHHWPSLIFIDRDWSLGIAMIKHHY